MPLNNNIIMTHALKIKINFSEIQVRQESSCKRHPLDKPKKTGYFSCRNSISQLYLDQIKITLGSNFSYAYSSPDL